MVRDFIEVYPNALSIDECNEIIRLSKAKLPDATDQPTNPLYNHIRKVNSGNRNDISIFADSFGSLRPAVRSIKKCITNHNSKYHVSTGNRNLIEYTRDSDLKIQVSYPGGGFCNWHTEQGNREGYSNRFMVWMIYLNTVNDGGKTEFRFFDSVKPVAGTLVYWPASYTHEHRAAPDLNEEKWIATGWFKYNLPTL